MTFDYQRLSRAIEIRDQSYRLLKWIGDAVDRGDILISRTARHSGGPVAATEWMKQNYYNIPEPLRPEKAQIGEFAAFFSTYLTSSFDVIENPGTRGAGPVPEYGCTCDLCVRIVNAPHLRTKKLFARDKRRANKLMVDALKELATNQGLELQTEPASEIATDENTRRSAAYLTYGDWLIRRLRGESDGPAVLALWRLIAWDPRGGMRPNFSLRIKDFKAAEEALLSAIQVHTRSHKD